MINVGDLIVGDVGRGDFENVACFDDHKKTRHCFGLFIFCFWRDVGRLFQSSR